MKNLEGIRNVEVKESSMEKTAMHALNTDPDNFDDCALTEKDQLQKLKEELLDFDDCAKKEDDIEIEESYDDCYKTR